MSVYLEGYTQQIDCTYQAEKLAKTPSLYQSS